MRLSARVAYLYKRGKQLFKDNVPTPSALIKMFKDKKVGVTKPQADQIIDKMKIDQFDKLTKLGKATKRVDKETVGVKQELPAKREIGVGQEVAQVQPASPPEPMKQTRSYGH